MIHGFVVFVLFMYYVQRIAQKLYIGREPQKVPINSIEYYGYDDKIPTKTYFGAFHSYCNTLNLPAILKQRGYGFQNEFGGSKNSLYYYPNSLEERNRN